MNVLLIDNDAMLLEAMRVLLFFKKFGVVAYESSLLAVEHFEDDPHWPDFVITENTMPEMSGVEVVKAIHSIRPDLPVILCTAEDGLFDKSESSLFDHIVFKPFMPEDLLDLLK
jgi:DNA-binding NtrC family response regulator